MNRMTRKQDRKKTFEFHKDQFHTPRKKRIARLRKYRDIIAQENLLRYADIIAKRVEKIQGDALPFLIDLNHEDAIVMAKKG